MQEWRNVLGNMACGIFFSGLVVRQTPELSAFNHPFQSLQFRARREAAAAFLPIKAHIYCFDEE